MIEINIDEIDNLFDRDKFIKENFIAEIIEISFSYKSYFRNSKVLRDFFDLILTNLNISLDWRIRFILIIDEINNNAIEYWSLEWETNYLRLKIIKKSEYININIEVEDTGNGEKAKKAENMYKLEKEYLNRTENKTIRWRWLFVIIKKLVDRLYFKDAQNGWLIVWIEKDLKLESN